VSLFRRYQLSAADGYLIPHRKNLYGLYYLREKQLRVTGEITKLCRQFGEILYGIRHKAPCSSWRSELAQLANYNYSRFANRVHIFQDRQGKYGRYVGYISLRPQVKTKGLAGFPFTALAFLALPSFMLRPRYHIISCIAGPADGVIPFRCVPFCSPNLDAKNRASCVHATLHNALILKINYLTRLLSSQDMIMLLWGHKKNEPPQHYAQQGATFIDAQSVLEEGNCSGSLLEVINEDLIWCKDINSSLKQSLAQLEAIRCITDYLANGMPVIMRTQETPQKRADKVPGEHTILLIGMHMMQDYGEAILPFLKLTGPYTPPPSQLVRELPGRFVINDIIKGPYHEERTIDLLSKAWKNAKCDKDNIKDETVSLSAVTFMVIAPRDTHCTISHMRELCLSHLALKCKDVSIKYQRDFNFAVMNNPDDAMDISWAFKNYRLLIRLYHTEQVIQRYLTPPDGASKQNYISFRADIEGYARDKNCELWWSVEVFMHNNETEDRVFTAEYIKDEMIDSIDSIDMSSYLSEVCPPMYVYLSPINILPEIETAQNRAFELFPLRMEYRGRISTSHAGEMKGRYFIVVENGGRYASKEIELQIIRA